MPYEDANHVKFIHAHQIAKNTWRNGSTAASGMPAGDAVFELASERADRDDESEIEEQLELAGGPVWFVDRARLHPKPQPRCGRHESLQSQEGHLQVGPDSGSIRDDSPAAPPSPCCHRRRVCLV